MSDKIISIDDAVKKIVSGMTLMIGGFLAVGAPNTIMDALLDCDIKDLTVIATTSAFADKGWGKLISQRKVKKAIVSHIGTNTETIKQFNAGEIEVEFASLGSLSDRIRAGGTGLGGILTRVGLGTLLEKDKQKVTVDGVEYLIETPLRADVSIVRASTSDEYGNLICRRSTRNFNTLMPYASDLCIAEVGEIIKVGEMDTDFIHVQHTLVDYIVKV